MNKDVIKRADAWMNAKRSRLPDENATDLIRDLRNELQPLKDLSDYLDGRLPIAEEGKRSKQDEWEAAYAFIFKRMNDLLQDLREKDAAISNLQRTIHYAKEVYIGMEGIPEPQTACESYLLQVIKDMYAELLIHQFGADSLASDHITSPAQKV